MPNYSHGTKLTLASVEEPPHLSVGTDVSAKYKGAFCEAKIINVNKHVKLRVLFEGGSRTYLIDDTDLKAGSTLQTGTQIEAKHPEKKQLTFQQATVTKILDHSRYTVVFDDGDQCVLRRNSICLKSGKHFAESETLDQLPLTNPEHFGNPVKVGAIEQLNNSTNNNQVQTSINSGSNNNNKAQNNHQLLNDKLSTKSKSSSSTTNSSSTTSEDQKSNVSEPTTVTPTTNNRKRHQQYQDSYSNDNIKKLKKERNSTQNNTSAAPGKRGPASKGRKRRDSVNNGTNSKNSIDLNDDSVESSLDSTDANPSESNVKFELIDIGVKLMVQYGKGKVQNVYEAKVNKIETNSAGRIRYFVHYTGWNNRYDEWITRNRILSIVAEKENGTKDGRTKQTETVAIITTAPPATTTTSPLTTNSTSLKDKGKEKERAKEEEERRKKEEEDRKKKEDEERRRKEEERKREEELKRKEEEKKKKEEEDRKKKEEEENKKKEEELKRKEEEKKREEELKRKEEEKKKRQEEEKKKEEEKLFIYKFCEEIDESDCDKKISILQERIMALRQTYISLKTELADLDRRRKRPRVERSNAEHINCSSGVMCRN